GLSPAISIDQKTTNRNPRSTVGTITEIYDYLRLLYARIGVAHCPVCGKKIEQQTIDQIVDSVMEIGEGTKFQILAPVVRGKKGMHQKVLEQARKSGFSRVRVDGNIYDLSEEISLEKNKKHNIEIVVDRLVVKDSIRGRLTDSLETTMKLAKGIAVVAIVGGEEITYSQNYACPEHGISVEEITPRMFSFNNPFGACPKCTGIGVFMKIDPDLIIPDPSKSIRQGGLKGSGWALEGNTIAEAYMVGLADHYGFSLDTPIEDLPKEIVDILLYGTKGEKFKIHRFSQRKGFESYETDFEGIIGNLERRYRETNSNWIKEEIQGYMSEHHCDECDGKRLRKESLAVTVGGKNISDFCDMSVVEAVEFLKNLELTDREKFIGKSILKEINSRLSFLNSVGLEYLTLSRSTGTLSGGESQRIRLATQIGSSLMGVVYILDEPSIGLHQRDNDKLLDTLRHLRDIGNTLIVVEHDEDTMRAADFLVDIGPGAGIHGGELIAAGTPEEVMANPNSITGQYLSGKRNIPVPEKRRKGNSKKITVYGAKENNLKNIDVDIPLGKFVCVTGVSGSGKSSFVNEIVYKHLCNVLNHAKKHTGKFSSIKGIDALDKVINIDQSPIGRTPRSNPATYTGVFNDIRELYASTSDAKAKGYGPNRFSFNVKGGRCEACQGAGTLTIEMNFLPDVFIPCDVCHGKRFNQETLDILYKGKSISDVLDMTIEEASDFFSGIPHIARKLETLKSVGLGYIQLGQNALTLSGGEAQRVKLASELSRPSTGKTLYILDEPTTGLHFVDIKQLMSVIQKLVDKGNSVVMIEHNLDVICQADYLIDLGPEGGSGGGSVIATGTPEEVAKSKESYTGKYVSQLLEREKERDRLL
ncbi:excinuclease ABC subunit UvrA, partial [uncultured Treponema sp.]|uniref:excinuclease ABC subunit UvrA n=1 Tax=uncultured Treponema sp. TaxID=162155 RepID=UPI0026015DB5